MKAAADSGARAPGNKPRAIPALLKLNRVEARQSSRRVAEREQQAVRRGCLRSTAAVRLRSGRGARHRMRRRRSETFALRHLTSRQKNKRQRAELNNLVGGRGSLGRRAQRLN